ncbi:hypothetical protein [Dongia sp.]|uniref:hypothetical protein n=1 Tax=Dongia sp. TaxID=1977262 RepID=UPI0035B02366
MTYRFLASLFSGLVMTGGVALAQNATPAGPALSVEELKTCLCQEPQLEAMRNEIATRRAMLDERQAQLNLLDAQIAERRKTLDPNDVIGQELLKNTMAQAASLRDLIQSDTRLSLNQAVADYNALAARYTETCVNRPRYAYDVDMAKKDLVCPLP